MANPGKIYDFGTLRIDTRARQVLKAGAPVALTPKAYDLLCVLVVNHGRAMSKAELQDALWPDSHVEEGNLAFQISALRKALGEPESQWIETVPRHGYRWGAPVTSTRAANRFIRPLVAAILVLISALSLYLLADWRGLQVEAPRPLTTFRGSELAPSFSPGGKDVAFVWNGPSGENWDIYVKTEGVEEPRRFTTGAEVDFSPVWSPDGGRIAFARLTGSGSLAVLIKPFPEGPEQEVIEPKRCAALLVPADRILDWLPDGRRLVIAGASPEESCGLATVDLADGKSETLTRPPREGVRDLSPSVSPDGRKLAFMRGSEWPSYSVETMPLSVDGQPGGPVVRLTADGESGAWPVWLPGSKEVVFSSVGSGAGGTLFRVPASGGKKAVRLPGVDPQALLPAVSKAGTLAYATQPTGTASIHRLTLAQGTGADETVELAQSTHMQQYPVISPDGSRVAFESARTGFREIWTCSADGTQLKQLTQFQGPAVQAPRWSPDGSRIVFKVADRQGREIFTIPADGGPARRLTFNEWDDAAPSFSHDGKWIYFGSTQWGVYQIARMSAEGGEAKQITKDGGNWARPSPDGRYLYYSTAKPGELHATLWRIPVDGGTPVRLVEGVLVPVGVWVAQNGVFFVQGPAPRERTEFKLRLLDARTGDVSDKAVLRGPLGWGMSVSPDARHVLFARNNLGLYDLKVVRLVR